MRTRAFSFLLLVSSLALAGPVKAPAPKVDLNSASEDELAALPGLTRELAHFLVTRRLVRGPYARVDDLQPLLAPDSWARVRDLVTVADSEDAPERPPPLAAGRTCRVKEVLDERTLRLACGGGEETWRLVQVTPPPSGSPGHVRARAALQAMLTAGEVLVFPETDGKDERDAEGRHLGWAQPVDCAMTVNERLVDEGWSRAPATAKCRRCDELREHEASAKSAWVGFWQRTGWRPADVRARD